MESDSKVSKANGEGLGAIDGVVRAVLDQSGKLPVEIDALNQDADLYEAGLTSLNTVDVMLGLEDHFDIEFEESMLTRATFQSIGALVDAINHMLD